MGHTYRYRVKKGEPKRKVNLEKYVTKCYSQMLPLIFQRLLPSIKPVVFDYFGKISVRYTQTLSFDNYHLRKTRGKFGDQVLTFTLRCYHGQLAPFQAGTCRRRYCYHWKRGKLQHRDIKSKTLSPKLSHALLKTLSKFNNPNYYPEVRQCRLSCQVNR